MNIVVIESNGVAGFGSIQCSMESETSCVVTSSTCMPPDLSHYDVIVLNNIDLSISSANASATRLEEYVRGGGGCLAIHDSTFLRPGFQSFLALLGLQLAFDGLGVRHGHAGAQEIVFLLALGDPTDPMQRFLVRADETEPAHPIVDGIDAFDLGDEFWAMNIAADVRPLLHAEVGDRLRVPPRLQRPSVVAGCRTVQNGRCVFLLLGHFPATYDNPFIRQFLRNAVLWAGKRTNASPWMYDLFLSFSSKDNQDANQIAEQAEELGLRCFLSEKQLEGGDIWDEEIRRGLLSSREMCVLMTERALGSEWVTTEWGIAWALEKRITPVLLHLQRGKLPDRLQRYQVEEYENVIRYLEQVRRRASVDVA